jgi:hypothetical protein
MLAAFAQVAVMRLAALGDSDRKSLDHHLLLFYSSVDQHGTSLRCAGMFDEEIPKIRSRKPKEGEPAHRQQKRHAMLTLA